MFFSDKFIFNGVHSDDMGVALVTFETDMFNDYGINFSQEISATKGGKDMSHFAYDGDEIGEIELNIALIDKDDNPVVWDDYTLMDIIDWLDTDSFAEFISEDNVDLVYYFKAKKIVKKLTHNRQGYLQVTFQPFSNSAYIKYSKRYKFDKSGGTITIENVSSLRELYKPVIEIKNLDDNLNIISIENITTGDEPFIMSDIDNGDVVTVDGLMGTVFNQYKDNLLMKCNRRWLKLAKGENKIQVSGNVEIYIRCQFPVRL